MGPIPVIEEKPIAVTTRRKSPNLFGPSSKSESAGANSPKATPTSPNIVAKIGVNTGANVVAPVSTVSNNPFGTPEDSPVKENVSNPFGEPDEEEEEFDSNNPF